MQRPSPGSLAARPRARFLAIGEPGVTAFALITSAALLLLVAYPLALVFAQAVFPQFPLATSGASLDAFQRIWASNYHLGVIVHSAQVGVGVAIVSVVLAVPAAFLVRRTDMPARGVLDLLMLVPFTSSPFLTAEAWIVLLQRRGYVEQLTGLEASRSEALLYSYPGIVLVMALHLFPLVYFSVAGAVAMIPTSILDAARTSGAGWRRTGLRIVLPSLLPSILGGALLVFAAAIAEYGTPAILGVQARFIVTAVDIANLTSQHPVDRPLAAALSVVLLAMTMAALVAARALVAATSHQGARSGSSVTRIPIGYARWGGFVYVALLAIVAGILPWAAVIATSMLRTVSGGLEWGNLDVQRLLALPMQPAAQQALLTSVELAAVASTTVAILGTAIAYLLTRTRVSGRGALDVISMLPSAAPGVVIAVAVIIVWNQPFMPKGIYGSQWVLAIAYAIVFLPYGVRYAVAAMHAVPATLDDAGRTSGAGEVRRFRRLLLPLILPSIVSAWVLAFAIGMRELENSLIVRPPGTTTVATYMWQNFAQGSVIDGMGMAVVSFAVTCAALVAIRLALGRTDPPLG